MKAGVAGHDKCGIGFHPLTAWCTNTGDHLVVMQRPGNAGSFTAADHVSVLDASLAQVPPAIGRICWSRSMGPAPPTR